MKPLLGWVTILYLLVSSAKAVEPSREWVSLNAQGQCSYRLDERGNRIPDFSHVGYGGGQAIPDGPVRVVVPASLEDSTARIQQAIDYVAQLPADGKGLRGTVLLLAGEHKLAGRLHIHGSGIVLRGVGKQTVLLATGVDRRPLISISNPRSPEIESQTYRISEDYVPVGANTFCLDSVEHLKVGDRVFVDYPVGKEWIQTLGMDRFPSKDKGSYLDWRPGTIQMRWDRTITKIEKHQITLDAPITNSLDAKFARSTLRKYSWPNRVRQVGIEQLHCASAFDARNPQDENHAWTGICIENAEDVWVRQVSFAHFAGSAVAIWESAKRVSVIACESRKPVSEIGGYRRHTFLTSGQQTLFLNCKADQGRHDFAVGHLAMGPNAFVHCQATNAHQFSGPIGSWATGVLYDNVSIDGAGLALTNREIENQGVGWAAANSVLWQCRAPRITCRMPPTAQNWALGLWGQYVGDGHWRNLNEFVKPESLYVAQLTDRLGNAAQEIWKSQPISTDATGAKSIADVATTQPIEAVAKKKSLQQINGWLAIEEHLLVGNRLNTVWWRGSDLPTRATEFGLGLTRFVPGRHGDGFTDDLIKLTERMSTQGVAVLDHHWGLWYDRRRDDHQMIRRMDGEVWAPFYELPWARSGQGKAWDGLSQYDLTQFNPWYFARLNEFAKLAEQKGLVLVQQMYFQHNILEAGAHWADFPWRPANCLQETGFPEPPNYVGGKRVFMAETFYDLSHSLRRELHQRYIRHCLDVLGGCPNVLFQIGEEFTGPLAFVVFWLETIAQWQTETGKKVRISLSCTKDVQDAILADPQRAALISVIDLKYWWYTADGGLYDPKAAQNLAPRQQWREWKGSKSRSEESIARAVREYRTKFPDKAITVSLDGANGWAVACAGGSIPRLPAQTDPALRKALIHMKPYELKEQTTGVYALAEPGQNYLVWSPTSQAISLDLSNQTQPLVGKYINAKTGKTLPVEIPLRVGQRNEIRPSGDGPMLVWIYRK